MPVQLRLSNQQQTDFYDFTNVASVVRFVSGTFNDQMSSDGVEDGIATFQTFTKASTQGAIQGAFKDIENLLELHRRWQGRKHAKQSAYLEVTRNSAARGRSRVTGWSRIDHNDGINDNLLDNSLEFTSTWTINRQPFWDDDGESTATLAAGCNMAGYDNAGTDDGYTEGVGTVFFGKGTAPGRITKTEILDLDIFRSINKFWFGFKDTEARVYSNDYWPFQRLESSWSSEWKNITGHSISNGDLTDTDAASDKCVNIDFNASEDYAPQFWLPMPGEGFPAANNPTRVGKYLVLLRMKLTNNTSECRVNMFQAWGDDWGDNTLVDTLQDIYITDDEYHFYEMGVIDFPPEGHREGYPDLYDVTPPIDYNRIGFGAERISGAANLRLDHVVLIPYEHFFSWDNLGAFPGSGSGTSPEGYRDMYITEEGFAYGFSVDTDTADSVPTTIHKLEIELNNWEMPHNPNHFYVGVGVADTAIGVTPTNPDTMLTETFQIKITYIPRYWSLNID